MCIFNILFTLISSCVAIGHFFVAWKKRKLVNLIFSLMAFSLALQMLTDFITFSAILMIVVLLIGLVLEVN